jgi:hypothetical protein
MLISRISLRIFNGTVGLPPREKPIAANKKQSVDGAEGLFLRSGSPQNVYLLPQRQKFQPRALPATETDLRPSKQ